MSTIDTLVQGFLAQKSIAVVGVSDKRETGCNLGYSKFKEAGYTVYGVNPRIATYADAPCYPDLKSIPVRPDAVFILANPAVTEMIVEQCIDLGVKYVWMHCMMGVRPGSGASSTSVSQEAVRRCQAHGIAVIPGSCPNQFLKPDAGHAMMRVFWRMIGNLRLHDAAKPVAPAA
jgi:predicted CoA-binding protein